MKNIINFADVAVKNNNGGNEVIITSHPYIIDENGIICIARSKDDTEDLPNNIFRLRSTKN